MNDQEKSETVSQQDLNVVSKFFINKLTRGSEQKCPGCKLLKK